MVHVLPEDIEQMAKYLGREDPAIRRLLKAAIRDPKMVQVVRNLLKRRCVGAGFDPDVPPVFWPVRELPGGFVTLGRVAQGSTPGPEFALSEQVITQHVGLLGHNGTGKSFLAMHLGAEAIRAGQRVWIFDVEDEYSRLVPMLPAGTLVALDPNDLRIGFFEPPGPWVSPTSWLDEMNLLLRGETFLRDGSLNMFSGGMARLLERKGIPQGSNDWPSLLEAIQYFRGVGFGPKSRSAQWQESLLNRFYMLADSFSHTARVASSDMLQTLAQRSVIFRLHGLTGIPLQFLTSYLLLWLSRYREGAPDDGVHMVIIEEAHMLTSEKSRQDIGESVLCRLFRTARKRRISLVLCDQVPSELPPAILGNLGCRVIMRLVNARCIWSVQSSMGLQREQVEAITELQPRQAIVQYPLHPTPFAIDVPELDFPAKPTEAELRRQAAEVLAGVHYSPPEDGAPHKAAPAAVPPPEPDDLTGDALLVMVRICEHPEESIEQRCEALRMDRATEFHARGDLDSRGLITEVEQTIGGKVKFFRPTDKGVAWAEKRHIRIKRFKSGIVHEYLLSQVERRIGLLGPRWRLQRNSSIGRDQGLQPDLLVMGPEGQRAIVEICCSSVDYDAANALTEAALAGVDKVIVITPDRRTMHAVEQALKKASESLKTGQRRRVTVLDSTRCLSEEFDWAAELEHGKENQP